MRMIKAGVEREKVYRDPVNPNDPINLGYLNSRIEAHAQNFDLHLTPEQNVWLDGIAVPFAKVNYLANITTDLQSTLDSKLPLAGGTLTGDLTIATGKKITLSTTPVNPTDVVNRAYVDSLVRGLKYRDPITDMNLVSDALTTPPGLPTTNDVYIVGVGATGAWAGKDRYATYHNGVEWVFLQNRAVQAGDRFGVSFDTTTNPVGALASYAEKVVTVVSVDGGVITYEAEEKVEGTTVLVMDPDAVRFGFTYTVNDVNKWIPTNTNVNINAGDALVMNGNTLSVAVGKGIRVVSDALVVATHLNGGLWTTDDGTTASGADTASLGIKLRDGTLSLTQQGLGVAQGTYDLIQGAVQKTGESVVTGNVSVTTGTLTVDLVRAGDAGLKDVVNRAYIDGKVNELTIVDNDLTSRIQALETDPTSAQALADGLALKVAKAGDTMTGALLLVAMTDQSDPKQAVPKEYLATKWNALDERITTVDTNSLKTSGGTITGPINYNPLNGPALPTELVNRKYVDDLADGIVHTNTAKNQEQDTLLVGLRTDVNGLLADPVEKSFVTSELAKVLYLSGGTMTGPLTLSGDPTQANHAATMSYVDNIASGLKVRNAVRLATLTAISAAYTNGTFGTGATLTGISNGALVVDGVTPDAGDTILVKNQTNKVQNGEYVVQQVGDSTTPFILMRTRNTDESWEIPRSFFFVTDGDTLEGTGWTLVVDNPNTFSLGTHPISVNQFTGRGTINVDKGLLLENNVINVHSKNGTIAVVSGSIDLAATGVAPGRYGFVTVDTYGRVTVGENETTLAGYGITDAQPKSAVLDKLSAITTDTGLLVRKDDGSFVGKSIAVGTPASGLSITNGNGLGSEAILINLNSSVDPTPNSVVQRNGDGAIVGDITGNVLGNSATATKLATPRTFSIDGNDVTAAGVTFDGTANLVLTASLTTRFTGSEENNFTKVTVNSKGVVTAGSAPTAIADLGITDVYTKPEVDNKVDALKLLVDQLRLESYLYT